MTNHPTSEKILIIENDLSVARHIVQLCFALGHEPLVARDGFTGMLLAKRVKPRLILSDLAIPGLDGFEIVRRVRQIRELDHTAVVAITGIAPGRAAHNQSNFDDYALKPINAVRLEHIIAQFCICIAHEAHA